MGIRFDYRENKAGDYMSKVDKNINNEVKVIDDKDIEVVKPKQLKQSRPGERLYDADILANQLNVYIDSVDDPHIQGFCMLPGMPNRDTLYELAKTSYHLSDILQKSKAKQEYNLVEKAMNGKCNPIFAIFRLKQPAFGWKDKVETENNTKITLDINLPDNVKKLSK